MILHITGIWRDELIDEDDSNDIVEIKRKSEQHEILGQELRR